MSPDPESDLDKREVIEPEVLPPAAQAQDEGEPRKKKEPDEDWTKWTKSMAPILVGIMIDGIDFMTMGPLGIQMGLIAGPIAAYAIASMYNMPFKYRILFAIGAGLYCTMPFTERLPLGTILGFILRFRK